MSSVKEVFEQINSGLSDASVKADAKKANAIFSFDFKSGGKYYIDLKNDGTAAEGASPGRPLAKDISEASLTFV